MAGKTKAKKKPTSRVHSVRWDAPEWGRIEDKARQMTAELPMAVEPVDVIRIAVRQYLEGSEK
jgi:hypothetical protein